MWRKLFKGQKGMQHQLQLTTIQYCISLLSYPTYDIQHGAVNMSQKNELN